MLLPLYGLALSRKSVTPMLHSIFDADSPRKAAPKTYMDDDGFAQRIGSGPARMPYGIIHCQKTRDDWRSTGVHLTIAGGCLLVGGGALVGYATFLLNEQRSSHVGTNGTLYLVCGAVMLITGAILALVGLPIWLTHLGAGAIN